MTQLLNLTVVSDEEAVEQCTTTEQLAKELSQEMHPDWYEDWCDDWNDDEWSQDD